MDFFENFEVYSFTEELSVRTYRSVSEVGEFDISRKDDCKTMAEFFRLLMNFPLDIFSNLSFMPGLLGKTKLYWKSIVSTTFKKIKYRFFSLLHTLS